MSSTVAVPPSPFANSFFLTGPTASGKTALSVEIARELGAEIFSLDSMAVYRRMDVGVAKPTVEERGGVLHRMIDVVEPSEEFSLAEYLKLAAEGVAECERSGRIPLFVGGTPLYLKAILFGVFEGPGADPEIRERLRREEEENGPGWLHRRLAERDPKSAERLHPNDTKRLIRALEILEVAGKPISELQTQFEAAPLVDPKRVFILTWERPALYDRINRRVDAMMEDGFLEETRSLFAETPPPGPTASKAVGYRELDAVLRGE
ncbi:MAG: tRNA (adenosine(37)-N6)-dimethylallyltransferase MiaA, partial [Thermoguttaceae bacterium]|nr:tRNA (adenosine(37)-N6)-dimethylallyltransferase MiaA [Thermoguttaceae bacterium]